jgi:AraC-like DNA-binding protein
LKRARDTDAKIARTEAFLLELLPPVDPPLARLRDLVERVGADRSLVRVEDLCGLAGLDARALQRAFRTYVGVSPKWVMQRYRLHEAAEQLRGHAPPSLAALAASLGYADQAHFARDFKRTVGHTPRAFVELTRGDASRPRP